MSKKLLSYSFKLLKLSTWISAILALLIVLFVATAVVFPVLIKAPLEANLSSLSGLDIELSKPYVTFEDGNFSLQIDELKVSEPEQKNLLMVADNLKWALHLRSLFGDTYRPSYVSVDTLELDLNAVGGKATFGVKQAQYLSDLLNSEIFSFFEVLEVNKMLIKDEKNIEITPLLMRSDDQQLTFKTNGQTLNIFGLNIDKADIVVSLPKVVAEDAMLNLSILISSKDFSTTANIKFINQEQSNIIEFESFIEPIPVDKIANYLSPQLVGDVAYTFIKRSFLTGNLQDIKLKIRKNLSKPDIAHVQFSGELKNTELAFHPKWERLKKLNANLQIDGKKITMMIYSAKLDNMLVNDTKVQIDDMFEANLEAKVAGKISGQSEHMIEFLKRSPLNKIVHKALNAIDLSGPADAVVALVIPLDESAATVDVDLLLRDNRLSILNDKVVVKDYDSEVRFHNNEITTFGTGNIRGIPFSIQINPDDQLDDKERIFGVRLASINNDNNLKVYITKKADQSWRANLDSKGAKGNMAIFPNDKGIPSVKLFDVQIQTLDAIKGNWKITPEDLSSMHLSVQNIYVNKNILPNFSAELFSKDNLMTIKDLQFEGFNIDNKAININGFWVDGRTRLYAKVAGKNLAEFFQQLKIKEKVTDGAFDFDIRLSCECEPWNISRRNIVGYLDMKVKHGVFTDQNPNMGRLLSLLNIKSIAKRLSLDFSDVVYEGFAYDNIEAQLHLNNAIAKIENFDLKSSSSAIKLTGQSHIVDQQYDLVARITPTVNDAVPLAVYLAGGGLTGLGAWLIDKIFFRGKLINKVVDNIVAFEYKITGSWDKPIIQEN